MKEAVIAELVQHAADELRHADMWHMRIIQARRHARHTSRRSCTMHTNCGYDAPNDPFVKKVLEQNIAGEQCAITTYKTLLNLR
jgi:bacterioferritin